MNGDPKATRTLTEDAALVRDLAARCFPGRLMGGPSYDPGTPLADALDDLEAIAALDLVAERDFAPLVAARGRAGDRHYLREYRREAHGCLMGMEARGWSAAEMREFRQQFIAEGD